MMCGPPGIWIWHGRRKAKGKRRKEVVPTGWSNAVDTAVSGVGRFKRSGTGSLNRSVKAWMPDLLRLIGPTRYLFDA